MATWIRPRSTPPPSPSSGCGTASRPVPIEDSVQPVGGGGRHHRCRSGAGVPRHRRARHPPVGRAARDPPPEYARSAEAPGRPPRDPRLGGRGPGPGGDRRRSRPLRDPGRPVPALRASTTPRFSIPAYSSHGARTSRPAPLPPSRLLAPGPQDARGEDERRPRPAERAALRLRGPHPLRPLPRRPGHPDGGRPGAGPAGRRWRADARRRPAPRPAGVHEADWSPPGCPSSTPLGFAHFAVEARDAADPPRPPWPGGSCRQSILNRSVLPVGRTFVKGVDLLDGHLVHQATDLQVPGPPPRSRGHPHLLQRRARAARACSGAGWSLRLRTRASSRTAAAASPPSSPPTAAARSSTPATGSGPSPRRRATTPGSSAPDSTPTASSTRPGTSTSSTSATPTGARRLEYIQEPHGDRLEFTYDGTSRLTQVSEVQPETGAVRDPSTSPTEPSSASTASSAPRSPPSRSPSTTSTTSAAT